MKIQGAIVLYNPCEIVINNINSYLANIEKLYMIDNSDNKDLELIKKLKNISNKSIYVDNKGNQGIANALNLGAKLAIADGADWLLTMDQDSKFYSNDFLLMLDALRKNNTENVAIISPMHDHEEIIKNKFLELITMTSGNLLNLNIYKKIGPFRNELFIDGVDTEYCLRVNSAGYELKRIKEVVLSHNLGNIGTCSFFGTKFSTTNHNALRRYYIIRNRFLIWSKYNNDYPDFIRFEKLVTIKELIKIILCENDKLRKIKMAINGYIDYKNYKFGKYEK